MKILPINNNCNSNNTNFKSLRSIKSTGCYSAHPELVQKLKNALKQNPTASAFFKKYDVDIVFNMVRQKIWQNIDVNEYGPDKCTMKIFYENPAQGKVKNFLKRLNDSRDYILIKAEEYVDCTDDLIEQILPQNPDKYVSGRGILSSKMQRIDKTLEGLDEKFFEEQKLKNVEKRIPLTDEEKAIIIKNMPTHHGQSDYERVKQMIREEEECRYHTWRESGAGLFGEDLEKYGKYVKSYMKPGIFTMDDYCYENRHLLNQK